MILVAGATGFLGRALVEALNEDGRSVRALVRHPAGRRDLFAHDVAIATGDVLDPETLDAALEGVSAVYYQVHAMGPQNHGNSTLETLERQGIENVIAACRRTGVSRIIYQGGLAESPSAPSAHLRARWQVEAALEASPLDFTVLRAGMIVGRGSVSFEVLARVVADLPVVPLFRWADQTMQPIALSDLLTLLIGCLDEPRTFRQTFDVGGERLSYSVLCEQMADLMGRRPLFLKLPVTAPRLTALGVAAATRTPLRFAAHLAPSLQEPLVCQDYVIKEIFPFRRKTFREAAREALRSPDRLEPPLWRPAELARLAGRAVGSMLSPLQQVRALPDTLRQAADDLAVLWDPR